MAEQPHSADVLDDSRDRWWNRDFLELLARRFGLDRVRRVLDVGAGHGHWGQLWRDLLPADAEVVGVDPEAEWVDRATERAAALGLTGRYSYRQGSAYDLPVEDGSFDWVTCQTVLMHLGDPEKALREMTRATAPGGLVAVAEPNNVVQYGTMDSIAEQMSPERVGDLVRFHLYCRRGQLALGRGDEAIGERLPVLMQQVGLEEVRTCVNDLCATATPPYDDDTREILASEVRFVEQKGWLYDRDRAQELFLAGGGEPDQFDALYGIFERRGRELVRTVADGTYRWAGGHLQYVVWARKPAWRGAAPTGQRLTSK